MSTDKPVLVASHEVNTYTGDTFHNIKVKVAYPEYHVSGQDLRGLQISAQQDDKREATRDGGSYAWEVGFTFGWGMGVTLEDAERMTKILRGVRASLNRQYAKHGPALDFAQYILRVATALKIDTIEVTGGYGSDHAGAAAQIREWEREFKARFDTTTEA